MPIGSLIRRFSLRAWGACALSLLLLSGASRAQRADQPQCGDGPQPLHTGRAYYYDADGSGNCGFDATPNDLMVAAVNTADYLGAYLCGASIRVTGPKGSVVVRVVDRCGGCPEGDIDLSPQAFAKIGDLPLGSVPVTWQIVASDISGPIRYHFQAESNQWWTAVQVRNHRYPIVRFEYKTAGGMFKRVERVNYNYFVEGMGPGPYTFRVTDVYGHTLTDSLIAHTPGADVPGRSQFPVSR
ncbi:MAG: expansin EXLX1 family cellulose-binding protein [Acidobacteriota bacterium]